MGAGAVGYWGRRTILRAATVWTLLLAVLALPVPLPAQTAGRTYSAIVIEGNQRIEDSTILANAGIAAGTPLTPGQINEALQRIQSSGLFESVTIVPQGNQLVITVQEFPTVNAISLEGNQRLNDDVLLSVIETQPRRVFVPSIVEQDARNIAEAYQVAGRLAATVTPRIIPRSQNRVDVVFEITEGATVEVERIGFVGNRSYSDRRLRQVLGTKQAGFLRIFIGRDQFVEDRISFDRQVLTDFYRSRGFIDFEVLSVSTEFSRERNAFFITFNIREGQQFRFDRIGVASEVPGLDAAPYADIPRTRPGQLFSPLRVDEGISRIERQLLSEGIEFVRVDPVIERNDRAQTLDLTYRLVQGPRIFVQRIDIEGNTQTRDAVIRRQFDTVEGDPFNPREIRDAAERIRALGFFATVDVNPREGTAPDRVIVDVDVEEQPTGSIGFGLNFSATDGLGGQFSIVERNFIGRGQTLSFTIAAGADNAAANISLLEPALLGRDVSGRIAVFVDRTDNFSADFDTNEIGFQPSIGFRISEFSRLTLRYRLSQDELLNVDEGDEDFPGDNGSSVILQNEEGSRITSSIGYTYSFDTRRVGLDPNSGVRVQFGQDIAGVGGDNEYLRTTALIAGETLVLSEEVEVRGELEGGALVMLGGEDSRIIDRFRAGRRVRGFARNGIGPRDLEATNEDALGGNFFAAFRVEAEFPVGIPEEIGVRGGVFFDAGSIWGLDETTGTNGVEVDDGFFLRSVVGVSLFWESAIGPLRFDFSRAIRSEDFDEEQNFDFNISARF